MNNPEPDQKDIDFVIAIFSKGQFQKALDEALEITKHSQKNAILHNIMGACYMQLGKLNSAVNSFNDAITIKPDYAKAHYNLGAAYHELDMYQESEKSYRNSISFDSVSYTHLTLPTICSV